MKNAKKTPVLSLRMPTKAEIRGEDTYISPNTGEQSDKRLAVSPSTNKSPFAFFQAFLVDSPPSSLSTEPMDSISKPSSGELQCRIGHFPRIDSLDEFRRRRKRNMSQDKPHDAKVSDSQRNSTSPGETEGNESYFSSSIS